MEFQTRPMVGKRKIELDEALPTAEAEDLGGFFQLARFGFQGRVKTEGDVPDLSGENQKDGAELRADLAVRKNRNHGQHDTGKKAEHRNGLQNIQQRDHHHFRAARIGGDVAVGEREKQAEKIGDGDAHHGVERVERKHAWILGDLRLRLDGPEPGTADGVHAVDSGENKKKNGDVDQESEIPMRAGGTPLRRRNRRGGLRGSGG